MNEFKHQICANVKFDEQLNKRHKWLLLGAKEKAKSVIQLTKGLDIKDVLEIGSGTGAVLETLDQLGFGENYYAIEPSEPLYCYMVKRHSISRLVSSESATLENCNLKERRYDLVILSHVLEHVENPAELLSCAFKITDLALLEVPLEGNVIGNLRATFKTYFTGFPRQNNSGGHIQFFSRADIRSLIYWCGSEIVNSRLYVPHVQMRMIRDNGTIAKRTYAKLVCVLNLVLGDWLWCRFYYGHYAVLVRRRASIEDENRSLWPTTNYYNKM
jgi:SAM-dependent methyltransferase